MLQQELVEVEMLSDEVEVTLGNGTGGRVEVGGLALAVLRVGCTAHHVVETVGAVAADDGDGTELPSQRLQDMLTELTQSAHDQLGVVKSVDHAQLAGGLRIQQLTHGEVRGEKFILVEDEIGGGHGGNWD